MKSVVKSFLIGLCVAGVCVLITYTTYLTIQKPSLFIPISLIIYIIGLIYFFKPIKKLALESFPIIAEWISELLDFKLSIDDPRKREWHNNEILNALLVVFGIICMVFSIPVLIIYWRFHPNSITKGLQKVIFLVSTGFSIGFYYINREKFSSLDSKISYFGTTIFFPNGVASILF